MKKILRILTAAVASVACLAVCACSSGPGFNDSASGSMPFSPADGMDMSEQFKDYDYNHTVVVENDFVETAKTPSSYFSLDRNTASYSMMRRQINDNSRVNKTAVRLEEYINYFNYDYARPTGDDALALSSSVFACPWNAEHALMTVGVAAEEVEYEDKRNNIVFLIDTSGSMCGDDRLPLLQQAFTMLVETLREDDTVSIVTYSGDSRVALNGEPGSNKLKIANVLQDLEASGGTNGQGGIEKAYALAAQYYSPEANNRVILATDGDFNIGASSASAVKALISEKRNSGIYLSVLGVGMYNTNDTTMKTLAENGNGNYAYIDTVAEARKVLVKELNGTFNVVAKDTKIGVEFNADTVAKYRLLGYETKMLTQEEFDDENKDAGELGSGHTVTAVYELELKDADGDIADIEVRYKDPQDDTSKSVKHTVATADYTEAPNEDSVFIGCVVEYGLLLRDSAYKSDASFAAVIDRLKTLDCTGAQSPDVFKAEFLQIVEKAASLY